MKPLRDFTVEELEALPGGTIVSWPHNGKEWSAVRIRGGTSPWRITEDCEDESPWMTHANIRQIAKDYGAVACSSHGKIIAPAPPSPIEALQPFARIAREILEATPDDHALVKVNGVWLTAGDFRRAAKAVADV